MNESLGNRKNFGDNGGDADLAGRARRGRFRQWLRNLFGRKSGEASLRDTLEEIIEEFGEGEGEGKANGPITNDERVMLANHQTRGAQEE